jgi:hypothetical protein
VHAPSEKVISLSHFLVLAHSLSLQEGPADHVLQGYMQLLNTLLLHNLSLAVALGSGEAGLMAHLFRDCLFNGPTLEDHGPLSPPKVCVVECVLSSPF